LSLLQTNKHLGTPNVVALVEEISMYREHITSSERVYYFIKETIFQYSIINLLYGGYYYIQEKENNISTL